MNTSSLPLGRRKYLWNIWEGGSHFKKLKGKGTEKKKPV